MGNAGDSDMNHGKQQHWLSECLGYRLHLSDCVGAGAGGGGKGGY